MLCFVFIITSNAGAEDEYNFERMWPKLEQPWYFDNVSDIDVGQNGNIFVADSGSHRILVFTPNGQFITKWGKKGEGQNEFNEPQGIAIDNNGNVYVSEYGDGDHGIKVFTEDGDFITMWGRHGEGIGEFLGARGIAIDDGGNIYIADTYNHRIQKFDSEHKYITQWGDEGSEEGQFIYPHYIAIDKNGDIHVTDPENHRIQKFTSEGEYLDSWDCDDFGYEYEYEYDYDSDFECSDDWYPTGIDTDDDGNIHVVSFGEWGASSSMVIVYSPDGECIMKWGEGGGGEGQFSGPVGFAVANTGNVYIADTWINRIQVFTTFGDDYGEYDYRSHYLTGWQSFSSDEGMLNYPQGIAVNSKEEIYVTDTGNGRVQVFSSTGEFLFEFDVLSGPSGIALDSQDNVYVTQTWDGNNIQKFSSRGEFKAEWGKEGSGDGEFQELSQIAVDSSGYIYVADKANYRIQKFTSDGKFVTKWGKKGGGDGEFGSEYDWASYGPSGVAIDNQGYVYVSDHDGHRIQKFKSDGTFIDKWGSEGSENNQLQWPLGINIGNDGNLYVADSGNDRIQIFTSTGDYIGQVGEQGSDPGQLNQPADLAAGSNGRLYVVDQLNNRIQVFSKQGPVDTPQIPIPQAPALTGSASGIQISLSWTPVDDADGYTLFFLPYTGADTNDIDPSTFESADMGALTQLSADLWEDAKFYVAIKAYNASGTSDFSNIITLATREAELPVPEPDSGAIGKAIVLAGGGGNTTLYPYSNKLCQQMYRLLNQRGFTDDDILYMNPQPPDIDEDGYLEDDRHDYNLFDPENDLKNAFAAAARGLSEGSQFVLYVHGHAEKDFLKITREYEISAAELKTLLGQIPDTVQQVIILDTCFSGSFLDDLGGVENRTVLTSADETVAWNVEYTNFSEKFIRSLRKGRNLKSAFEAAEDMIHGDPKLFGDQAPQLDDDNDGVYTSRDGVKAAQIFLGKEGVQAAEPPAITRVHPRIEIPEGKADETLWIETLPSGDDRIKKVKAVLIPPEFTPTEYSGEATQFNEKELTLIYNASQERYEIHYENFRQKGIWRILYQVQGSDGEWSDIEFGEVNAGGVTEIVSISVDLNQTVYQVSEKLRFDVTINGEGTIDFYVVVIFPQGIFQTFSYPQTPSIANVLTPYQSNLVISGQETYSVLGWELPQGLNQGTYQACAVVAPGEADPWTIKNWYDFECKTFELK